MQIKIRNNFTEKAFNTYTLSSTTKGDGTIGIRDPNGFVAKWGVQFGETGEGDTEIKTIGASDASGTSLVLSGTLTHDHPADTPVYAVKWDQLVIKRSTSGTSGTATAITDGTINITPNYEYTLYDDTSGASTYAYKVSLYNSQLANASSDSDWILPAGYSFYSLYELRNRAKRKMLNIDFIKDDDIIDDWLNEWLERMTTEAIDVNKDYLIGTVDVAHGTDGLGTITSTDYHDLRRVWFTTNGTNFYNARKRELTDIYPAETYNETAPYYYFQGDNVIGKLPDATAGTARIHYYKRPPKLSDEGDELPVSMQSYTKSFVDYAIAQAYYLDKNDKLGDKYLTEAERILQMFINKITPRQNTGAQHIKIVEPIDSSENNYLDVN